jgi:cytochrome c553
MTPRQLVVILGTSLLLAPVACNKKSGPKSQPKTANQPPATPSAPAPVPAAPAPDDETVAAFAADPHQHMKAHFVRALKLQDAVLAGNLAEAKAQSLWMETHDKADAPAGWQPYLAVFQAKAKVVADATSIDVAAAAVSQIAAACGDCHAANNATPKIGGAPIFEKVASVKQHMAGQIEALDKLWAGLVVPSDRAWGEGAALLANVAVTQKALIKEGLDKAESATVLAETLHQLSAKAGKASKADRSQVYAELLTTCVACHAAVRRPVGIAAAAPGAGQP